MMSYIDNSVSKSGAGPQGPIGPHEGPELLIEAPTGTHGACWGQHRVPMPPTGPRVQTFAQINHPEKLYLRCKSQLFGRNWTSSTKPDRNMFPDFPSPAARPFHGLWLLSQIQNRVLRFSKPCCQSLSCLLLFFQPQNDKIQAKLRWWCQTSLA